MRENYEPGITPDGHVEENYEELISFAALKYFIKRDFIKTHGKVTFKNFFYALLVEPGYKYVFWLRLTRYFYLKKWVGVLPFVICRFILKHYQYKWEFDITYRTPIGPGLSIAHIGYIVLAAKKVGSNCYLRPGVVVGKNLLDKGETAAIGDNVHFGVGSKVMGPVHIGNNVMIGANAVVTHDVPSNTVVAGVPAREIRRFDAVGEHVIK